MNYCVKKLGYLYYTCNIFIKKVTGVEPPTTQHMLQTTAVIQQVIFLSDIVIIINHGRSLMLRLVW